MIAFQLGSRGIREAGFYLLEKKKKGKEYKKRNIYKKRYIKTVKPRWNLPRIPKELLSTYYTQSWHKMLKNLIRM